MSENSLAVQKMPTILQVAIFIWLGRAVESLTSVIFLEIIQQNRYRWFHISIHIIVILLVVGLLKRNKYCYAFTKFLVGYNILFRLIAYREVIRSPDLDWYPILGHTFDWPISVLIIFTTVYLILDFFVLYILIRYKKLFK